MVGNRVIRNDRETQRKYAQPWRGCDDGRRQKRLAYRRWLDVENQERQRDSEDAVADRDYATWVLRERSVFGSVDVVSSCLAHRHPPRRRSSTSRNPQSLCPVSIRGAATRRAIRFPPGNW